MLLFITHIVWLGIVLHFTFAALAAPQKRRRH